MVTIRSISLFYNDRETFAQTIAVHKLEGARVPHRVESLCRDTVLTMFTKVVLYVSPNPHGMGAHTDPKTTCQYIGLLHIFINLLSVAYFFFLFFTSLHLIGLNLNSILMSNRKAYYNCHSNEEYMYIVCQRKRCRCSIRADQHYFSQS